MKYTVKTVEKQTEWDEFVTSFSEANFLQSWDFYEFYQSRGFDIVRRGVYDENNQLVGVYAGEVEPAKRGRHLAVAGGPIFGWSNQEIKQLIFDDMKQQAKMYFHPCTSSTSEYSREREDFSATRLP